MEGTQLLEARPPVAQGTQHDVLVGNDQARDVMPVADVTTVALVRRFASLVRSCEWADMLEDEDAQMMIAQAAPRLTDFDGVRPLLTLTPVLPEGEERDGCARLFADFWRLLTHDREFPGRLFGFEAIGPQRFRFAHDGRAPGIYWEVIDVGPHGVQHVTACSPHFARRSEWRLPDGVSAVPSIGVLTAALLHPAWATSLRTDTETCVWIPGVTIDHPGRTERFAHCARLAYSRDRARLEMRVDHHAVAERGWIVPITLYSRRIELTADDGR